MIVIYFRHIPYGVSMSDTIKMVKLNISNLLLVEKYIGSEPHFQQKYLSCKRACNEQKTQLQPRLQQQKSRMQPTFQLERKTELKSYFNPSCKFKKISVANTVATDKKFNCNHTFNW
jgi:hypothetical protein